MIPIATATTKIPPMAAAASTSGRPERTGTRTPAKQRAHYPELQRRPIEDHGEIRAAVVEHHHFMDHRQLQVRVGIIDGNPAAFGQKDDQEGAGDQQQGCSRMHPHGQG